MSLEATLRPIYDDIGAGNIILSELPSFREELDMCFKQATKLAERVLKCLQRKKYNKMNRLNEKIKQMK